MTTDMDDSPDCRRCGHYYLTNENVFQHDCRNPNKEIRMTDTDTTVKPGRKPSPLLAYQKANQAAERARKAYAKVERLAVAKEEAEEAEAAAYAALQEALGDLPAPPGIDA